MSVLDRFLRYVAIDTRANEDSKSCPSTPGQLVLMRILAAELNRIGLDDVALDDNGYLMATIPATTTATVPTIGFIAHVDTSPEMSATDVRPLVHPSYDGRDLVLPDDPSAVLRLSEQPDLLSQFGNDIVTASGLTLLGADDKAGVAEIVTAADHLMRHPEIAHGPIRIAFTPDEEIGRGADRFDVQQFGAVCAYTLDGGPRGELEYESFSADAMTLTFKGFNTHPGYAKGRMVNAIRLAARFIDRLPAQGMSPETTGGHEGFVHPYQMEASVDRTRVKVLIRDFVTAALAGKEALVERLAREVVSSVARRWRSRSKSPTATCARSWIDTRTSSSARAKRSAAPASNRSSGRSAAAPTARDCRSWGCRRRISSPASTTSTLGLSGCRCRTWKRPRR